MRRTKFADKGLRVRNYKESKLFVLRIIITFSD
jgi:hypothetical protein